MHRRDKQDSMGNFTFLQFSASETFEVETLLSV